MQHPINMPGHLDHLITAGSNFSNEVIYALQSIYVQMKLELEAELSNQVFYLFVQQFVSIFFAL